jgi:hypothetical protein
MEEAKFKKAKPGNKTKEERPIPKEKIILSSREDGLLWFEMLKILSTIRTKNGIISFPNYFEQICRKFSIKKSKAWNCMFFLVEFGLIEIVSCHGIRLKYSVTKN